MMPSNGLRSSSPTQPPGGRRRRGVVWGEGVARHNYDSRHVDALLGTSTSTTTSYTSPSPSIPPPPSVSSSTSCSEFDDVFGGPPRFPSLFSSFSSSSLAPPPRRTYSDTYRDPFSGGTYSNTYSNAYNSPSKPSVPNTTSRGSPLPVFDSFFFGEKGARSSTFSPSSTTTTTFPSAMSPPPPPSSLSSSSSDFADLLGKHRGSHNSNSNNNNEEYMHKVVPRSSSQQRASTFNNKLRNESDIGGAPKPRFSGAKSFQHQSDSAVQFKNIWKPRKSDEFWITIGDIRLITNPAVVSPPSRPPPIPGMKSRRVTKNDDAIRKSFANTEVLKNENPDFVATKQEATMGKPRLVKEARERVERIQETMAKPTKDGERRKEGERDRRKDWEGEDGERRKEWEGERRKDWEGEDRERRTEWEGERRKDREGDDGERRKEREGERKEQEGEDRERRKQREGEDGGLGNGERRKEKERHRKERQKRREKEHEVESSSFTPSGTRGSSTPRQRTTGMASHLNSPQSNNKAFPTTKQHKGPTVLMASVRKVASTTNIADEQASISDTTPPSTAEFKHEESESTERSKAKWERHQRTLERAAKALEEKNERDLQTQWEQDERHRLGETLDKEIKRWALGKEGNLRALLSSLHHIVWPECGWQAVSLTELTTVVAVKKAYRKAALCIHPDKVQQKGASVKQKYISEKVFDLLKEAWNIFNSQGLF